MLQVEATVRSTHGCYHGYASGRGGRLALLWRQSRGAEEQIFISVLAILLSSEVK